MLRYNEGKPLIVWCSHRNFDNPAHMLECVDALVSSDSYSLAVYYTEDWNKDYSPWPAYNPVNGLSFEGEGRATADRLEIEISEIRKKYDISKIYLCGYSLAGLFVLWLGIRCEWADGAICSSGSMWFDGFIDYLTDTECLSGKYIYLSLGGKEKQAGNPVMRTIEDKTREAEMILKTKKNIDRIKFELNSGGHFADSCKRMAGGVKWILKEKTNLEIDSLGI